MCGHLPEIWTKPGAGVARCAYTRYLRCMHTKEMKKPMTESEILAHAEALANGQGTYPHPTEADFEQAEAEIRAMVAEGLVYDANHGWVQP